MRLLSLLRFVSQQKMHKARSWSKCIYSRTVQLTKIHFPSGVLPLDPRRTSNPKVKESKQMKPKSNAPWILGVVGFCISIPQICCSILCAAASADVASDSTTTSDQTAAAAGMGVYAMLPVVTTVLCFILSFFGKSNASTATGVMLILVSLANIVFCAMNFSAFGIAASVCFFCSGISSICNTKKPKE